MKYINEIKNGCVLQFFANNNNLAMVSFLIDNDSPNYYSLIASSIKGRLDMVTLLVENGSNIHAQNDSPILASIFGNQIHVVKYFISLKEKYSNFRKALEFCINNGNLEMIKYLMENKSHFNNANYDEIIDHCLSNYSESITDIIKYFIETSIDGKNILLNSAEKGRLDIIISLFNHGIDIHYNNDILLCVASYHGYLDIVRFLIENGALIHGESKKKISLKLAYRDVICYFDYWSLHISAKKGHLHVVQYLVNNGALVRIDNDYALFVSMMYGQIDVTNYLLTCYPIDELKEVLLLNKSKIMEYMINLGLVNFPLLIQTFREMGIDLFDMIENENITL